jgi:protein-S-isoprenylcysteine O-methyltransferase Ste14
MIFQITETTWTIWIYWLTLLILGTIRFHHYLANADNVASSHIGPSEYLVFIGLTIFGLIIPIMSLNFYSSLSYSVPFWLQLIGIIILFSSIMLFCQTLSDLGRQDSPTLQIKEKHQLVNDGVYHYVRHPMYAGGLLIILAHILLVPNITSLISTMIVFLIIIMVRIPFEEQMLQREFGQEYEQYKRTTCGLIPKLCHI